VLLSAPVLTTLIVIVDAYWLTIDIGCGVHTSKPCMVDNTALL